MIKKIDAGDEKRLAAIEILRDYIKVSKKIRFEGDGYSLNWEKEAKKRRKLKVIGNVGKSFHL